MAVIAKWLCDRDNSMFDSKKEAEAHDRDLELAAQFSALLMAHIPEVDSRAAEKFGLLLANNKDSVIEACKGNADALSRLEGNSQNNVTPLMAEA